LLSCDETQSGAELYPWFIALPTGSIIKPIATPIKA